MTIIKRHIPNFVTALGLLSGCISIVYSTSSNLKLAGIFILVAALFDFIDGWIARKLNSIGDFGKQLDSLADVVSFGVAPSFIVYKLMQFSLVDSSPQSNFNIAEPGLAQTLILSLSFLIAIFAALRLAQFNTDTTQEESFRGLPTPAAALLIASCGFVVYTKQGLPLEHLLLKLWFLLILIAVVSWLMVSGIRMFSLKFKHYGFRENALRYIFLALALVLIVFFRLPGIAPVIVLYVLMSLLKPLFEVSKH
ncbi:MAG: CDP-diacylglycerol--serine O-phosphatidyltransferase [Bacteroidales bacterium]|nr:CDP-diacylglycerol--serine O-phosphatidyltransferase [Bacteroidales bacterium]MBN2763780.1 CDP-diacylglycerol--serine O-phosphatidyltransferase [Bacteroidales bacterium]